MCKFESLVNRKSDKKANASPEKKRDWSDRIYNFRSVLIVGKDEERVPQQQDLYEPNASDKQLSFLVFVHGFKEVSLGIVCMRTFIRNTSLASFRVGSFAWELSFGILRFETFVWNLSVDSLRLGPAFFAVWNLWIGNFARHCAF